MLSLAERVIRTIQRYSLFPPDSRVVVAVSGGADSTALACLLADVSARLGFRLVGIAHFNHGLRGAAADQDEAFCRALAERLGLAWQPGAGDVRDFAARSGTSIEDAGRRLRYRFFERAAGALEATHVAVGHTRDDQAETVLLQLFRGAGPRGLRAMEAARWLAPPSGGSPAGNVGGLGGVRLVRPLLEVGHDDLVAWLDGRRVAFREDESNRDPRFLRNRLRHEVIPFLRSHVGASIARVLARDAAIAGSDAACLDDLAHAAFTRLATVAPDRVEVDRAGLAAEPEAIGRRVVLMAAGNLREPSFVGFDQGDRLLALAAGRVPGPIALPGATARVTVAHLVLLRAESGAGRPRGRAQPPGMNFWRSVLSIPGEAVLPGTGLTVSSAVRHLDGSPDTASLRAAGRSGNQAVVDAARVAHLAVRTRRPGDWLRPLGLGGRKKLQDYFVDRKVPREQRDRVPLVVDDRDRIVWVAGHGIDEEFRVGAGTRDVVILKLRGESA